VASSLILRWKNVHLIIEAFLRMAQEGQSLHIYGFSTTPLERDYQDEIVRLAKPHSNIFLHQWDPDWTNSLCSGDIFVHAADREPFGIVLLEAYARGCRMVVPSGTFLDELPSSGVFQSALNSPALAQAMAAAFASPSSSDFWQERQPVAQLFSLENTRQELSQIYHDLTDATGLSQKAL
jgi:glycosyltransferase involved in cell wall biosynthesis